MGAVTWIEVTEVFLPGQSEIVDVVVRQRNGLEGKGRVDEHALRGLLYGEAELQVRLDSVSIFKHDSMTTGMGRPRRFEFSSKEPSKPAKGASDHFPITMQIVADTASGDAHAN